jgi:hypothetical protein
MRIGTVTEKISEIVESNDDSMTKFMRMLNMSKSMNMNCSQLWFKDLQIHAPHCLRKFDDMRENKIMGALTKLIEQGKKEKMIDSAPTNILITAIMGAMDAVTHSEFIINSKFSFHDAQRIVAEIFFNGILTPAGKVKYADTKKLFENVL